MKRLLIAGTLALALITPAVVIAQSQPTPDEAMEEIAAIVIAAGYALPTTTTAPPTTTTAPTTTTTAPTTTTAAPTTTTVAPTTTAPTTTTTLPPPPVRGDGPRFTIILSQENATGPNPSLWNADYFRTLPYTSNTGWTDGDRSGYRCAYMFLVQGSNIVGRVTFIRVEAPAGSSGYGIVNDSGMDEGVRFYDGTLAPANGPNELGDCPQSDIPYETFNGPTQLPTVIYETTSGSILEVRNYKTTVTGPGVTFRQVESTDQLVTVVGYKNGLPMIVVYYESMSPSVVMISDFN